MTSNPFGPDPRDQFAARTVRFAGAAEVAVRRSPLAEEWGAPPDPLGGDPRDHADAEAFRLANPKDRVGVAKAGISALPWPPIAEAGVVHQEGAAKYGRHNWRAAPVLASVYVNAAARHLAAWYEGEDTDPGSVAGTSHLAAAIAGLAILRDAQIRGTLVDDRPPATRGFLERLGRGLERIRAAYPDPVPPVTAADAPAVTVTAEPA